MILHRLGLVCHLLAALLMIGWIWKFVMALLRWDSSLVGFSAALSTATLSLSLLGSKLTGVE